MASYFVLACAHQRIRR